MIDALISGRLVRAPERRSAQASGREFVACKLQAGTDGGESLWVDVVAFQPSVCAQLLALEVGASLSVSGPLSLRAWTDREGAARPGASLVAHEVLTPYGLRKRARAINDAKAGGDGGGE